MSEEIAQRIIRDLGLEDLHFILAKNLSGADLHSLMLAVIKLRVEKIEASKLIGSGSVTKACNLDGRLLSRVECTAFEAAKEFEVVELSPLAPLGAVAALTGLDQANVLSTIRSFECVSDPTIGLALECAQRRKSSAERKNATRVCTSQRVVRFPAPQDPAYTAHFKLFAMVSAGRDPGSFAFELSALREHIEVYLSVLSMLKSEGFVFKDITVELSDTRVVSHLCSMFNIGREHIRTAVRARDSSSSARVLDQFSNIWPKFVTNPSDDLAEYNLPKHLMMQLNLLDQFVCAPLKEVHNVRFQFNMHRLTGMGYYEGGPCFHIRLKNDRGQEFALADGGLVTWTQKMLCDSKERLMTSAIGLELMCRMFRHSQE